MTLIGAGSHSFSLTLTGDLLTYPELEGMTLSLMDIDEERLASTARIVKRVVEQNGFNAEVQVTTDRKEALRDADYVITSIRSGGMEATRLDLEIPAKYGIEQGVGDTLGPGGVFYGLKNASALLEIARDAEELSRDAMLINYTNPMAIVSWAVLDGTRLRYVGLCHSVPGTARELASYMGIAPEELSYTAAGINHMAWFIELVWRGEDAYPILREKLSDPRVYTDPSHPAYNDLVRVEVFKAVGYYSAEDSNHLSEYLPYFRKDEETLKKYRVLDHADRLRVMEQRAQNDERRRAELESGGKVELRRSGEFATRIIYAMETGNPVKIYANVKNRGVIENLPYESVVEVPALVDGRGVHPTYVGRLPPQLAALNAMDISAQELAARAIEERSRERVFQALLVDPLTSSALTIPRIREMTDEMLRAEAPYLPELRRSSRSAKGKRGEGI